MWKSTCPRCGGSADPSCERCGGRGEAEWDRCPASVSKGTREFVDAAVVLERDGLAPAPGAGGDQAAWFMDALGVWHGERAAIERRRRAAEEA